MRTSGEKVCIMDGAERVQSISYPHTQGFISSYTSYTYPHSYPHIHRSRTKNKDGWGKFYFVT